MGSVACEGEVYPAQKRVELYIMMDDSGSFVPFWPATLDAITNFLNDPESAGIGVGVQFFGSNCDPAYYQTPRVPIAPLPDNEAAIRAAFPVLPSEGTATLPAVQGALAHARQRAADHPDASVAVMLITDGLPTDCGSTVENVSAAIGAGLSGSPPIKTFVVGVGTDLDAINMFAAAGGTGQAHLVEAGAGQALLNAVRAVRSEAAAGCDFPLPQSGAPLDRTRINLRATIAGAQELVPWVGRPDSCDPALGGWYFDATETKALLCPSSCEARNGQGAALDFVIGCARVEL